MPTPLRFGWLSPVIGNKWSDFQPIAPWQDRHLLPTVLPHFDSLWVADHFYGFDAKTDPFLEAWTTLTWLAARHESVELCHHVLGHGYRPPALTAKMAATLQTLSGGRFVLGIGAGWREDEYRSYGYEFPKPSVRFAQLEEVVTICRLMWTEAEPTFHGHTSASTARRPRRYPIPSRASASVRPASGSACPWSAASPTAGTPSRHGPTTTSGAGSTSCATPRRQPAATPTRSRSR